MNAYLMRLLPLLVLALGLLTGGTTNLIAQDQPAAPQLTRQDVDVLLDRARQALAKGDLATADGLVKRAETATVRYPLLHMGDTPAKARKEISALLAKQAKGADPFLATNQVPVAKPQAAPAPRTLPAADPASMAKLPASNAVAPLSYPTTDTTPKAQAAGLIVQARQALAAGKTAEAEALATKLNELKVPDSAFGPGEDKPAQLAWDLQKARYAAQTSGNVVTAGGAMPLGSPKMAAQAGYVPEQDTTKNTPAAAYGQSNQYGQSALPQPSQLRFAQLPAPEALPATSPNSASGLELLKQGEDALRAQDLSKAAELFRAASQRRADLDPVAQARLDEHLQMLPASSGGSSPPGEPTDDLMAGADEAQQVLARQLLADIGQKQVDAKQLREKSPKEALAMLQATMTEIEKSNLPEATREQFARRVTNSINETEKYILDNKAQIELDEANAAVIAEVERTRAMRLKMQDSIASLVDQFNKKFYEEHAYAEAELIAKRLHEMAPNDPVAQQVWLNAKFLRREMEMRDIRERREESNYNIMAQVDDSSISPLQGGESIAYSKDWTDYANRKSLKEVGRRRSEREIQIEQKLTTPVQLKYENRPLAEVIDGLSQMTGVNIHLDPRGLNQEGVSTDTPVSINLTNEISLRSALNLILEPLHLGFTIKDEVLKVTSETLRDGDIYTETYYVADLVIPIPNFVPSSNIGLQSLINDAHAAIGYGGGGLGAPGAMSFAGARRPVVNGPNGQPLPADAMAQNFGPGVGGAGAVSPSSVPISGSGPGSLGGGANADFDSLIDLIVSTVATETWAENGGGEAEIRPFPTNLSLVISQTQAVHEEIADLLEQLRRLQDLQVTIEVRFIRLNDNFFERIGVDFDVNINDKTINNANITAVGGVNQFETPNRSATVGVDASAASAGIGAPLPNFTADLDIPFRQGSFGVTTPQFGGYDLGSAATFGFAILSDIEAYFLIQATQGSSRTNLLNAPKVTLFNGQQAFVSDTSQTPFVISVIPVVGEFAAAQQPVIVVLSEGTLMTIQAVISDDRRHVRMTVVPFFSTIGDVQEFTFEGSTTTTSSSASTDDDEDGTNETEEEADNVVRSGTTVQLPTFQFVSVTTTVSVPDGGTVLLGGIKRLNEGRREFGVPLLSKVPYVNRLFRNVGIGRTTDSLMMMVTPRIIIQEEEEEKLGIAKE